nr:hypothetical protein GCM10020093_099630 [Planobispora longispora]
MRELSQAARGVNWLITDFVNNVPGVAHTVVVSADGLPLAFSDGFPGTGRISWPRSRPACSA